MALQNLFYVWSLPNRLHISQTDYMFTLCPPEVFITNFVNRNLYFVIHPSYFVLRISYFVVRTSYFVFRCSLFVLRSWSLHHHLSTVSELTVVAATSSSALSLKER
jgi:hypothetical protein